MATAIEGFMWHEGETCWTYRGQQIPVTEGYLAARVREIMAAAPLNPGWGTVRAATRRWCVAVYTQSRFWEKAFNDRLNRNGTVDRGIAQVNSIHFRPGGDWWTFCQERGLDADPSLVWDPAVNLQFAAWYNQKAIEDDYDTYHFNRTKIQQELYAELLKVD